MDVKVGLNEQYPIFLRGKIVAVCEMVLREQIGVIAGSRQLVSLGSALCGEHDEDFIPFLAVDSETDHLPVDGERRNWSIESLERKDKEISDYEASARSEVFESCRKLISTFGFKD